MLFSAKAQNRFWSVDMQHGTGIGYIRFCMLLHSVCQELSTDCFHLIKSVP
uniref:Uncharacterized protein n=1 Tax=Rhizophora mucronata TaxID=61149 RepID=A0A2P2NWE5_RHIMU